MKTNRNIIVFLANLRIEKSNGYMAILCPYWRANRGLPLIMINSYYILMQRRIGPFNLDQNLNMKSLYHIFLLLYPYKCLFDSTKPKRVNINGLASFL